MITKIAPILIFLFFLFTGHLYAQMISSPVNAGLGGGGTAYTLGYESLFINPANLFIRERNYRYQLSGGTFGAYYTPPVQKSSTKRNTLSLYLDQTNSFSIGEVETIRNHEKIINRSFNENQETAEYRSKGEINWFGIHWHTSDRSYAIAFRSRYANRFVVGRNYYDGRPLTLNGSLTFNRSLDQQYQSFHELSFGYAELFTFVNGLFPQVSQIIVGVAPKLIASGSYFEATYRNISMTNDGADQLQSTRSYHQLSSGTFSDLMFNHSPFNRRDLFNPTGFGAGLDIGITYLITLGNDLSAAASRESPTHKSLRVSLSLTDIGFVNYHKDPREYSIVETTTDIDQFPSPSDIVFNGMPGELFHFLDVNEDNPLANAANNNDDRFSILLPATLHAGTLFHINRIKLMGDFSLGLVNSSFKTTRFITYLGAEVRILPFLPLRAGTRLAHHLPGYYSFGAGVESKHFDLNIAIQLRSESSGPTTELSGISVAALKVYIP